MAKLGTDKKPAVVKVQTHERAEEVIALCNEHGWKVVISVEPDEPEDISDIERLQNPPTPDRAVVRVNRNAPCPCGSGKKYKKCCMKESASSQPAIRKGNDSDVVPRCGLCGKTTQLTKTECCDNWICDDEHKYRLFSYERNSCHRNHRRYTMCGYHYAHDHSGNWKDCEECKAEFKTEMYVYMGTNQYNFEILTNPPDYEPTKCSKCNKRIRLGEEGGYSIQRDQYLCERCTEETLSSKFKSP